MQGIGSKGLVLRKPIEADGEDLKKWLVDPAILRWFPMCNDREVIDSVRVWIGYAVSGAGLTAVYDGKACGMFNLYIQPFKKLSHTCLFSIIVDKAHRGKGIGKTLLQEGQKLAKEHYGIEVLHLEVYEGNPAQRLYEREGFVVYGKQPHFIKDQGEYITKIFMQKSL
jgi:ribosomal protein S18 acetylase RimI-like enzyme